MGTTRANEHPDLSLLEQRWELITFDVFDTLLTRDTVLPKSAATIVKKELGLKTPLLWRFGVEHALRISNGIVGKVRETSFKQISAFVSGKFINKEKIFEEKVLKPRALGLDLLRKASSQGQRIAYISDTCYSSAEIQRFLQKAGVPILGPIFVSNELGATKREGGAYKKVGSLLGVNSSDWLHIGDDLIADNVSAKKSGLSTITLAKQSDVLRELINKRHFDFLTRSKGLDSLVAFGIFSNQAELSSEFKENYFYRIGFTTIGPLVCGFAEWINRQNQPHHPIAFLGRDGFLPKQIFDLMNESRQKSLYIRVSRRKLLVPAWLSSSNKASSFVRRMPRRNTESVAEYMERLGLDCDESISESKQLEIALNSNNVRNQAVNERDQLKDLVESISEVEFLVDVGWRATLQEALQMLGSRNIGGLYLGTSSTAFIKRPGAKGWLTNSGRPYRYGKVLRQSIGFIERSFSEQVPSELGNNTRQVGFEVDERVSAIQQGAIDFAKLWSEKSQQYDTKITRELGISGLQSVMLFPEIIDLEKIGRIGHQHDPNVGVIDQTGLIPNFSTTLTRLKEIPNSKAVKANWPIGYEKEVFNKLKSSGRKPNRFSVIFWEVGSYRDFLNLRSMKILVFSVHARWRHQLRSNSSSRI